MKYLKLKTGLGLVMASGLMMFSSCSKVDTPTPLGDAGQTIVKFLDVDFKAINIDLKSTPQTIDMVDIRRDVPNSKELARTMNVVVKDDPGAVADYNAANGTTFVPIPAGQYTIDASNPLIGTNYKLVMNPGEFAKNIKFTLPNALALDLNKTYAFGFSLTSVDADGHIANEAKKIVVQIGVKNQWDGVYNCTWTNYHPASNPGYTGDVTEVEMRTTGANKVKIFWPLAGAYCAPAVLNGGLSYFGAQEPEYTINTTTNAVTVQNAFSGATTFYTMNGSFNSRWDAASTTFFVKWGYNYDAGGVFNPANNREWTQTIKYLRPR